jgi:hypothetical protein
MRGQRYKDFSRFDEKFDGSRESRLKTIKLFLLKVDI